jgi:hypothetical protein
MQKRFMGLLLLLGTICIIGCAAGPDIEPVVKRSEPFLLVQQSKDLTEKLHHNQKELSRIYQNIRSISEGNLFYGSDEQLNTIQKSSLYVLSSTRTAYHQWELLSIMAYIHPDNQNDYISFLVKDLRQSVFNSAYDLNFLNTSYALIENREAREYIDNAVVLIRQSIDLYKKLMALFESDPDLHDSIQDK